MNRTDTDRFLDCMRSLIGTRLLGFYRIVVWIDNERVELPDSIIIHREGAQYIQISSDAQEQSARLMSSDRDYLIQGEYGERTREELVHASEKFEPFWVDSVHVAQDKDNSHDEIYLIGAFLSSASGSVVSLNFHLDDVELGAPLALWAYLNSILLQTIDLRVERI